MTYKQLLSKLANIPANLLEDDVTILIDGEYVSADSCGFCDDGVLHDGHFYIKSYNFQKTGV
jgi:hypothetical protein